MMANGNNKIWTSANVVTLSRICLVPLFAVVLLSPWPTWLGVENFVTSEIKSIVAAAVFIIISSTDWIDGYLARSRDEITVFGKFIDPLADKILVMAALLALIELQVLPSWPVLIILAREFIVSGLRMLASSKGIIIAASWYGKTKTVLQIVAIVLFLLKEGIYLPNLQSVWQNPLYILAWTVMIAALVMTVLSMMDYIAKCKTLLGFTKHAEASSPETCEKDCNSTFNMISTSEDTDNLALDVINLAKEKGLSLSTAESLTGGMIAAALTSIPGSSDAFKGSIVSYVNDVKSEVLSVDAGQLKKDGAVNASTVIQMAKGACKVLNSDISVAVSGIAGPTGAENGKPVGTVFLGWAKGPNTGSFEYHFSGNRQAVRDSTTHAALQVFKKLILG